jgi:hypothetical protein
MSMSMTNFAMLDNPLEFESFGNGSISVNLFFFFFIKDEALCASKLISDHTRFIYHGMQNKLQ